MIWIAASDCHAQCLKGQGSLQPGRDGIADDPAGTGIENGCQVDEAHAETDVSDVSQPHLVQPVHRYSLDEVGIPVEWMLAVSRLYPLPSRPAEQVGLPHKAQHFLVIDNLALVLELFGDAPVAIAGKLQTDGLNTVDDIRIGVGRCLTPVVKCAPGDIHQSASSPYAVDEARPPADDFPFRGDWLRLCCSPFLRTRSPE